MYIFLFYLPTMTARTFLAAKSLRDIHYYRRHHVIKSLTQIYYFSAIKVVSLLAPATAAGRLINCSFCDG